MSRQQILDGSGRAAGENARQRLLAGAPVAERWFRLAGVSTAVLEGGGGPPVVLLHGQGSWAGMWLPVIPDLVTTPMSSPPTCRAWAPRRHPTARRPPPGCSPGSAS